ncbi:hypothetical protein GCM10009827_074180 [Dactylosporangium maewongense]|uniref:TetR family transcriptional regulator n=1 Tax=Dactylosporangium maewongense TaxID=634393 RepID=A0ABP4MGJ1_9ACTN
MRWFRRKAAGRAVLVDPARQEALLADVRQRYGPHVAGGWQQQAASLAQVFAGDDGLSAATRIVHDTAEHAHADVQSQVRGHRVDRRDYRALYRQMGPHLRYRLTELPTGLFPYVHLAAALTAVEADAKRAMVLTDPNLLLVHTLELLDLTVSGWEYGRVPVNADAARLVSLLIAAATRMRLTEDDPPALPPGIREVMRSNRSTDVYDHAGTLVGTINVGAETRRSFLI